MPANSAASTVVPADSIFPAANAAPVPTRFSTRIKTTPKYLNEYKCNVLNSLGSEHHHSGTPYPLTDFTSFTHLSSPHIAYLLSLSIVLEPQTYTQVVKHACWIDAMDKEIVALESNRTWTLTALPFGKKPIGSKWVYKIKRKTDGSIERYKACLVAKGYTQLEGVDYSETFSSVVKLTMV